MLLSWNEIKSRALTFSRTWSDAAVEKALRSLRWQKTYRNDAERVAFLFACTSVRPVFRGQRKANGTAKHPTKEMPCEPSPTTA